MDGTRVRTPSEEFGRVSVRPLGPERPSHLYRSVYTWHPGDRIASDGREALTIRFHCLVGSNGARGFAPAEDVSDFLLRASAGGLMILAKRQGMEPRLRGHHHALRLIYQHADLVEERLARSFQRLSDLAVVGDDGAALGGRDVLPDQLGLDSRDRDGDERWSVRELMGRGRDAAIEAGNADPDDERCIAAGLHEAARRDPIPSDRLSETEARALVNLALFDPPPPVQMDPDEERAVARILDRLGRYIEGDTATFNLRFFDGRDDVIGQVARQVKGGGPIDRAVVRRAFLRLVCNAYDSVGACVSAQMAAFLDCLPQPLDPAERSRFAALYLGQPYLGGIPLIMLWERFPFLRGRCSSSWAIPTIAAGRASCYACWRTTPRWPSDAERPISLYKRRANQRNDVGRLALNLPLDDDSGTLSDDPMAHAASREFADRLRWLGGISCPCGAGGIWHAELEDQGADDAIEVGVHCMKCGRGDHFPVRRDELAWVGRGMQE